MPIIMVINAVLLHTYSTLSTVDGTTQRDSFGVYFGKPAVEEIRLDGVFVENV